VFHRAKQTCKCSLLSRIRGTFKACEFLLRFTQAEIENEEGLKRKYISMRESFVASLKTLTRVQYLEITPGDVRGLEAEHFRKS